MENSIFVTFQVEGVHRAPDLLELDEHYLHAVHRHKFHFRVTVEVRHLQRDIEFIKFRRWCRDQYPSGLVNFGERSCEMIAKDLGYAILETFPNRALIVEVSEDGENGCQIHM